jgi:hypothetical protein
MAEKLDPKETISILELTVSHMWSIAALVEVFERKGLLTKQEVRDVITELRRQTPKADQANPPLDAIPEPYLMQDTEDRVIQGILDLLNMNGLTAQQARSLLGKLHLLIDLGEQLGRKTTH